MKKVCLLIILLGLTPLLFSQDVDTMISSEKMPEFPGGQAALYEYIKTVKMPAEAISKGISGKVYVSFIIDTTGATKEVKATTNIGGGCEQAAEALVKNMPHWTPASQGNKKVQIKYTLPIKFERTEINSGRSNVDVEPEFESGTDGFTAFLQQNIKYPEMAKTKKIQGKVYVQFKINTNRKVEQLKVLRGIGAGCDEEALRVIQLTSGKWKPGLQNGKPAEVEYTVPVKFSLGN